MKWVIQTGNSRINGNDQMQKTKEKIEKKLCRFKIIIKKDEKEKNAKKNLRLF